MALATEATGDGILTNQDHAKRDYTFFVLGATVTFRQIRTSETRLWTALTEDAAKAKIDPETLENNQRGRVIEENRYTGPASYGAEITTETESTSIVTPEPEPE